VPADGEAADPKDVAPQTLRQVLDLLQGTSIEEIEVEWGEGRVKLRRNAAANPALYQSQFDSSSHAEEPVTPELVITSPYVGVFHRDEGRSWPKPGEAVKSGDVVAEVETLRMRNAVTAPSDAVIVELLVAEGMPVEYGQPLVVLHREEAPL